MSRIALPVVSALITSLLLPTAASAQYFGRNKVQWEDLDFHVLETERFDLYHYPEGNPASMDGARMAERWYGRLSTAFDYQFALRQPIILYNDHADFQQTDVTGGIIGEGTGGFTEPLKNRVVLPLTGSYADTDHVIGHELVHAFQYDLAARLATDQRGRVDLHRLPLWMVEGLAEYLSQGRDDPHTAMWLRDSLLREDLPTVEDLNRGYRFNPYHYGQAFYAFVGGEWGDAAVMRLFAARLRMEREQAFAEVLGTSPNDVFERWHAEIRRVYEPIVEARGGLEALGDPLIRTDVSRRMEVGPALSPDGSTVAFLSTLNLFTIDLFLADAETGEVRDELFSAASDPHMDSLRFVDSAGAWSPDGRRFAFVAFAKGTNRLVILDTGSRDVVRQISIPGVGALSSPAWSPDGRSIVVSGMRQGVSDVYLVDVESGDARQLTDDRYADLQPVFSPDGSEILLVTDRGPDTDLDALDFAPLALGFLDPDTGSIRTLEVFRGHRHVNPQFGPDGEIYFLSDPEGISDLFRHWPDTGGTERITRVTTGVVGISPSSPALSVASNGDVVFSVFSNGGYELRRLSAAEVAERATPVGPEPADFDRAGVLPPIVPRTESPVQAYLEAPEPAPPVPEPASLRDYRSRLGLSFVGPAAMGFFSDQRNFALGGSLTTVWSDVLNDHQVALAIQGGNATGDLATAIGAQAIYLNQSNRFIWGAAGSHLPSVTGRTFARDTVVDIDGQAVPALEIEQIRREVVIDEATLIGAYPFSRTRRVELDVGFSHYGFDLERERILVVGNTVVERQTEDLATAPSLNLYQAELAYVGDTSYFGLASPVRGGRMRLAVNTTQGDLDFQTVTADLRKYFFWRPVTLAVRGLHFGRYGDDSESDLLGDLFLGRETLVRGYSIDSFDLDECTSVPGTSECPEFDRLVGSRIGLLNLELRVPLLGPESFGLIELPHLPTELLAFVDAGAAWTQAGSPELSFDRNSLERVPVVSAGIGLRSLLLGAIPIQVYYASPLHRPEKDAVFGLLIAPGW